MNAPLRITGRALACLAAGLLAACSTQQQLAADRYREQQRADERQAAYNERLWTQCRAMGHELYTDGFRRCVIELHRQQGGNAAQMEPIVPEPSAGRREMKSIPDCVSLPPARAGWLKAEGGCR